MLPSCGNVDETRLDALQGRNVIIEQAYGGPKITKDGVTVAKAIEFENRYQNVGASLVKQVASATNDVAGDGNYQHHMTPFDTVNVRLHIQALGILVSAFECTGTTTATVLTRAILSEGCKSVAAGMNPMDLRRGINLAVEHVLADLKKRAKMISTTEEIAQVLWPVFALCSTIFTDFASTATECQPEHTMLCLMSSLSPNQ